MQRFRHVRGALEILVLDDKAEAVDRRQMLVAIEVEAPDRHLLAGQLIIDHVELQPCITRIGAVGIPPRDIVQRRQCALGGGLIAANVKDALELAHRHQVIGVRRILVAGVQRNETLRVLDGVVVLAGLIVGIRFHQHGAARPRRVRMLALDFLEGDQRVGPAAAVEQACAAIVELRHRFLDVLHLFTTAHAPAGGDTPGQQHQGEGAG